MNDKQVQDLIRGQFMNEMIFRNMDEAREARARGVQIKPTLFENIIGWGFVLFWGILLGGTLILSILGGILSIFE